MIRGARSVRRVRHRQNLAKSQTIILVPELRTELNHNDEKHFDLSTSSTAILRINDCAEVCSRHSEQQRCPILVFNS